MEGKQDHHNANKEFEGIKDNENGKEEELVTLEWKQNKISILMGMNYLKE